MDNKPTDDDNDDYPPLTVEGLNHLQDFIRRGVMDFALKGENLVLEAALGVPKMPEYVTYREIGTISLRAILAVTILNSEREEIYGEEAREKLLALAGRLRELVRLLEQRAEKLLQDEEEPDFSTSLDLLKREQAVKEEFPEGVDLGDEDEDDPFDSLLRKTP